MIFITIRLVVRGRNMRIQKKILVKIFSLLLISVLCISLFSTVGATTYHAFFANGIFEKGTKIGPVDVSSLTKEEAKTYILSDIETWYDVGKLSIISGEEEVYVLEKRQVFSFDILNSINTAEAGKQNPLLATINENVLNQVVNELKQNNEQEIDMEKLKSELQQPAQTLHPGELAFNLGHYTTVNEGNVVSQVTINHINDESGLMKWVKEFGNVTIPANSPFSLSKLLLENDVLNKYSNETLSIIATGIYSTILSTNFDIVERHVSDKLPSYAAFGHEAMIEKEKKDLIIYNKNPYEYKLNFSLIDKGFEVQLTGAEMPQEISIVIKDEESFDPKKIKQFDSTLKRGQSIVKQKGVEGKVGKIYRIIKERGQLEQRVLVAQDYYPPIPIIEVQSILVPEKEQQTNSLDEDSNGTDPDVDPNLPNENPLSENGEENSKDNSETDLWEDPDPLHLQKS